MEKDGSVVLQSEKSEKSKTFCLNCFTPSLSPSISISSQEWRGGFFTVLMKGERLVHRFTLFLFRIVMSVCHPCVWFAVYNLSFFFTEDTHSQQRAHLVSNRLFLSFLSLSLLFLSFPLLFLFFFSSPNTPIVNHPSGRKCVSRL